MSRKIADPGMSLGRALWGMHSLWATVLAAWLEKNYPQDHDAGLRGIEFDKLAHLLHLIWECLFDKKQVSFPSVYVSSNGIHGPGPALEERAAVDNSTMPALEAIRHIQSVLQGNPDLFIFELKTKVWNGNTLFDVRPGRERSYLGLHLSGIIGPAFRDRDQHFVNQLADIVREFSDEEMRALGTHQNYLQTFIAIEYNVFVHLFFRFMLEISTIENRGNVPEAKRRRRRVRKQGELPALTSVIDEIGRKSDRNRNPYASAREKLYRRASQGNEVAQMALGTIFQTAESIWTAEVVKWKLVEEMMVDLQRYLKALRDVYLPQAEPIDPDRRQKQSESLERDREDAVEAIKHLGTCCKVRLPSIPKENQTSFDWSELRCSLVDIFDTLPTCHSEYWENYEATTKNFRRVGF